MESFRIIYTLLGGLGIFFFGMRSMTDSLQVIAGDLIKKIIHSLTTNRFVAVIVGLLVTMIVQSSSVTTVMVVGFVNAGLMELYQAIGVILGANIGTTVTGWIISIKIGKYGLLLIGLGIFPALFAKNEKWKQGGRCLFGIGMIFFGLDIMSGAFKPLRSSPKFIDLLSYFDGQDYSSYIASIILGCVLTLMVQSSSAMLGITIALGVSGVISYHTAAALVLGENVGTTITALLASVGGITNAKRAALAHSLFNLLGVAIVLTIFPHYVNFVDWLIPGEANFVDASGSQPFIAVHIATGHTIFNVTATIIFLPFIRILAQFVTILIPHKSVDESPKFVLLGDSLNILPATALVQADIEIKSFKEIVEKMFAVTREYLLDDKDDPTTLAEINNYELITDNVQKEVTLFVCKVMVKPLTVSQSAHAQSLVRLADELESVADYLDRIAIYRSQFRSSLELDGEAGKDFFALFDEVWKYFQITTRGIDSDVLPDEDLIIRKSEELSILANSMRDSHIQRVGEGKYSALSSLTYSDMVVALRKIRSHSLNIAQAVQRAKVLRA